MVSGDTIFKVKKGSKLDRRLSVECKVIEVGSVLATVIALVLAYKKWGLGVEMAVVGLATLVVVAFVIIVVCAVINIFVR